LERGVFNDFHLHKLRGVGDVRQDFLAKEKQFLRIKSRSLWLKAGDNNREFFHHYASMWKNTNTIWEMQA
jgi:hypothetical protein